MGALNDKHRQHCVIPRADDLAVTQRMLGRHCTVLAWQAYPACPTLYATHLSIHRDFKMSSWSRKSMTVRSDQRHRELHTAESASIPPKPVTQSTSLLQKGLGLTLVVSLAGILLLKQFTSKPANVAESGDDTQESQGSHQDSKDFKAAVARTRQAVCVQKAIGFMDASSPVKAIVELKHALEENGIARGPLLVSKYDKNDRLRLYRLHLQNTEVPPNFAILLQLREMLAISEADAEQLEVEVFESGGAFSI